MRQICKKKTGKFRKEKKFFLNIPHLYSVNEKSIITLYARNW